METLKLKEQLSDTEIIEQMANREYKYGFETKIDMDVVPKGLNEDIIRLISKKKNEPEFMLEWRLQAFRHWQIFTQCQS